MLGDLLMHILEFMKLTIFFPPCCHLQLGLRTNITQEVLYPATFTDIEVRPLNGDNRYVIHFNPDAPYR